MTSTQLKNHAEMLTAQAGELERNLARLAQSHAAARDQLTAVRGAIQAVSQLAELAASAEAAASTEASTTLDRAADAPATNVTPLPDKG